MIWEKRGITDKEIFRGYCLEKATAWMELNPEEYKELWDALNKMLGLIE